MKGSFKTYKEKREMVYKIIKLKLYLRKIDLRG